MFQEAVSTDDDQYDNVTEVIVQTDSLSPVSFIADSESSHTKSLYTNSDNNCEITSKTKKRRKSGVVEAEFVKALNELGQDHRDAKCLPDDLRSFIEFIGHELMDVYNNKPSYKKCKREIIKVIQNSVDENEI